MIKRVLPYLVMFFLIHLISKPLWAQSELDQIGDNYAVCSAQISFGKLTVSGIGGWRGLASKLGQSAYEAIPCALLQHLGMKLVSKNSDWALLAQLTTQKAYEVQWRSMHDLCVYCAPTLTDINFDYLGVNVRIEAGRARVRYNQATLVALANYGEYNLDWKRSFATGIFIHTAPEIIQAKRLYHGGVETVAEIAGRHQSGLIIITDRNDEDAALMDYRIRHELVHFLQYVRGSALPDALFAKSMGQEGSGAMRVNIGGLVHSGRTSDILRALGIQTPLFSEREAYSYAKR